MPNTFPLTETLARNCCVDELAKWCGISEATAAGIIDAIDGNPDWRGVWSAGDSQSAQERADYSAGYVLGQTMQDTVPVAA